MLKAASPLPLINSGYKIIVGGFTAQFFTVGFFTYSVSLFFPLIISELDSDITDLLDVAQSYVEA